MVVVSRNGKRKSIINSNSSNNINNENDNNNNNRSVKIFILTLEFISALCHECDYDFDYDVV